ncbi:hypothetical protein RHMOL_Rhmol05G0101100 [Rhododendron molle]|uniref:Uncharacterized protein n=1 Tax=Rhododendron molle TaxID=49168 RepID=A0ACC0NM56_RHOML|nr:hypothetical protein RHMOL_Rhmol05G0101100 [Rhododendron molle]
MLKSMALVSSYGGGRLVAVAPRYCGNGEWRWLCDVDVQHAGGCAMWSLGDGDNSPWHVKIVQCNSY